MGLRSLYELWHPCAVPLNEHSSPVQHVSIHPFQERVANQPGWLEHVRVQGQVPLPEGHDLNPLQTDIVPLVCQERTVMLCVLWPAQLGCCNQGRGAPSTCSIPYEAHSSTFLPVDPKKEAVWQEEPQVPGLAAGLGPGWAGSHSLGAQAHPGTPGSEFPAPARGFSCHGGCRHSGSCSCTQHRGTWQSHEAQTVVRWPVRHRPL